MDGRKKDASGPIANTSPLKQKRSATRQTNASCKKSKITKKQETTSPGVNARARTPTSIGSCTRFPINKELEEYSEQAEKKHNNIKIGGDELKERDT